MCRRSRACARPTNCWAIRRKGIQYCERALALDPLLEDTRRFLIPAYLQLGDSEVAELLVEDQAE